MPGLLAYFDPSQGSDPSEVLARMSQALEPEAHYRCETQSGEGFALGRVTTGILNPQAQPVWDEGGSSFIFMEGELYNASELAGRLNTTNTGLGSSDDARLVLELYRQEGPSCFSDLNGSFIAAIWDGDRERLVLANDRLGLYPLYVYISKKRFAFASGVRALLAVPGIAKNVDHTAIAEFLTFDHVLGDRTFLRDVKRLPQGTVLTYANGKTEQQRYWQPTFPEHHARFMERDLIQRFIELMRQSIERQAPQDDSVGLLLSGGMDSRMLLCFMAQSPAHYENLTTFSWGIPGCDDARYAAESAKLAGVDNYFYKLEPDWLHGLAEDCVRISDGMGNIVNMHALATLKQQTEHARIIYKGFLGDAMFGFGIRPRYWAEYQQEDRVHTHLDAYRDYDVLTFDLNRHEQVFTDAFNDISAGGILSDYQGVMEASQTGDLSEQRIYIDLTQRVPRMTLNGIEAVRSRAAVRLPFADNDLVEFSLGLAPGLRLNRSLMVKAFVEAFPQYAQIPLASTGLPLTACARDVALRAAKLVRWHLHSRGLGWLAGPERRPYKDYDSWFRTVLRDWVQRLLLSERSLGRGYMRPDVLREIVEDHMQGANHAVQLGALLSVELWHRMYLD